MKKTRFVSADAESIRLCATLLDNNGLVAFPTETVYGLGGLGLCEKTVTKIFEAKKRPHTNPLILHVAKADQARQLFDFHGSDYQDLFIKRFELLSSLFWPGPLTLVGKKTGNVPACVTANLAKVAVRIPSHPVAQELLSFLGKPIAAPSANLFTRPSPTTGKHVLATLDGRVDAVLDAGFTEYGIESTVIDIDAPKPKILRHGALSSSILKEVLGELESSSLGATSTNTASPGQCIKHYSPLLKGAVALASEKELAQAWFGPIGLVLRHSTAENLSKSLGKRLPSAGPISRVPDDPKGFAREIFAALYEMEKNQPEGLLIEDLVPLSADLEWSAVCDRLIRAQTRQQS